VTAIEIGDENDPGWGGDWLIACNRYGIDGAAYAAGNAATARQSYDGDADADFGPLSEYKIFVNEPDIVEFPSGIQEIEVDVISVDLCDDGNSFISFVSVGRTGWSRQCRTCRNIVFRAFVCRSEYRSFPDVRHRRRDRNEGTSRASGYAGIHWFVLGQ